jgi:hypothetical protein
VNKRRRRTEDDLFHDFKRVSRRQGAICQEATWPYSAGERMKARVKLGRDARFHVDTNQARSQRKGNCLKPKSYVGVDQYDVRRRKPTHLLGTVRERGKVVHKETALEGPRKCVVPLVFADGKRRPRPQLLNTTFASLPPQFLYRTQEGPGFNMDLASSALWLRRLRINTQDCNVQQRESRRTLIILQ